MLLVGYKMKKRIGAIEEFTIETLTEGQSLHCVLVVSGWIEHVCYLIIQPLNLYLCQELSV